MRTIDGDALSAFVGDLRSALHKEQTKFRAMTDIEFNTRDYMLLHFQYVIDNAPTIERPQGEWIKEGEVHSKCSRCGFKYADYRILFNFCPNCGADMRGGRE